MGADRLGDTAMRLLIAAVLLFSSAAGGAATLYECRAYNGSSFFSADPCAQRKAVGVYLHTVPDGMSFDQQVSLIEEGQKRKAANAKNEDAARVRQGECGQIDRELKDLQTKYTSWQYFPIDQVNADQARERDLKARRSHFQCDSQ